MMLAGLLGTLLAAAPPAATPAPASIPGAEGEPVRVERRLLLKKGHAFITGGLGYLSRGDYYTSPGLHASGSWYPFEDGGVELKAALFISWLGPAGTEVFERTGLVPDAHRPVAMLAPGWRQSLGYGKLLVGSTDNKVVHFDIQATGHLGLTFTDRGVSPSLLLGPGLILRFTPRVHAQLDVPLVMSIEQRTRGSFSLGLLPTFTLGAVL
ncbi:MAG TPA: hypothetical protein VF794_29595 [Archangium sp.]|jgi:hypothetical protein|uniref:hypothetical protein n=1 Tax=Archangium sp. TaxID=1872627 RepID=UPI002ED97B89